MTALDIRSLGKFASALLLGVALAGSPALADKGGNGGNGGNGGGSSHSGGNGNGKSGGDHGKSGGNSSKSDADTTDTDTTDVTTTESTTKTYGTVNGFLHASTNGIKHASANSAVGRVRDAYAAVAATATDGQALLDALQAYSKKPVTKDMLLAADKKLADAGIITPEQQTTLDGYVNALP